LSIGYWYALYSYGTEFKRFRSKCSFFIASEDNNHNRRRIWEETRVRTVASSTNCTPGPHRPTPFRAHEISVHTSEVPISNHSIGSSQPTIVEPKAPATRL
jgi:hypothetical protein